MGYQVKTEVYEGPFDLLLDLISQQKLDIYDISLAQITTGYLDYLQRMSQINLEITSEFLLVAATLLEIKARGLLQEEESDLVFPSTREELASRLIEYKKFKNAAIFLREKFKTQSQFFPREVFSEKQLNLLSPDFFKSFSLRDLAQVFVSLSLKNKPPNFFPPISAPLKIEEKIDFVLKRLRSLGRQTFKVLTKDSLNKADVIGIFLALLELYRQGQIFLEQPKAFGDIYIDIGVRP